MNKAGQLNVKQLLLDAEVELSGEDTARLDAEVLLAWSLGLQRSQLYARPETVVAKEQVAVFQSLLEKRKAGWPLAYLTGSKEFWSLELKVNEYTLVPRPETECLVEAAIERIASDAPCDILDLGTGSGAIALAIASERKNAQVLAVDVSEEALAQARDNAASLGIKNISFCLSDWFDGLGDRHYDLIVSNPPYVETADPLLGSSDIKFEPRLALDGGADGLDAIRKIVPGARNLLRVGGYILLEHGYQQAQAVADLLSTYQFHSVSCLKDYAGLDRISCGIKES